MNNYKLYKLVFNNIYISIKIFNYIREFNKSLKYIRFNYYDFPIISIIKNNDKSMLLDKIKTHNNSENKIQFNLEWYIKLLEWKQLDIQLFKIVYSTFKNVINITTSLETQYKLIQILIDNNNSNVLQVMNDNDEKKLIKQAISKLKYQLLSSELQSFIIQYSFKDGYSHSSFDRYLYRNSNSYYFNQLLSIESIDCIVKNGGIISNEYIENAMKAMVFIYQIDQVSHFQYIKYMYENYLNKSCIIESLKSIAVKNNDEKVYRLIYGNYQINNKDNIKPSFLYKFNENQGNNKLIHLCDGITVRLSEFLNIPTNILMGKLNSLTDPRFEIVKQISKEIPKTFFGILRVIEDPYILDYLIENEPKSNKIHNIYTTCALKDDCSNKRYFIDNSLKLYSVNSITKKYDGENSYPYDQPSYEKVQTMINSNLNLTSDRSQFLLFKVVNDNPNLLSNVIGTNINGRHSELLHQVAKMGFNNTVHEIIKNRSTILFNGRRQNESLLIENLFTSIEKTKSNYLFGQLLKIAKSEGTLISRISLIHEKICSSKIPSNQTERSIYFTQINTLLNNCSGSYESFIKFCCNKLSIHEHSIDNYPIVHNYLLSLDPELVSTFLNGNEINVLVKLVLSTNSELLINEFKYLLNNSNQLDKQIYLTYYLKSRNLKSFNYLVQFMELDLFIDISDLFEYLVKNGIVETINYFLSKDLFDNLNLKQKQKQQQQQIDFNYYQCFIHLLIVKYVSIFQSKKTNSLIDQFLNTNYSFTPLIELHHIKEMVYQIFSENIITKIQSLQNVQSFLKSVGLIHFFKIEIGNDNQLIDFSILNNNLNF